MPTSSAERALLARSVRAHARSPPNSRLAGVTDWHSGRVPTRAGAAGPCERSLSCLGQFGAQMQSRGWSALQEGHGRAALLEEGGSWREDKIEGVGGNGRTIMLCMSVPHPCPESRTPHALAANASHRRRRVMASGARGWGSPCKVRCVPPRVQSREGKSKTVKAGQLFSD